MCCAREWIRVCADDVAVIIRAGLIPKRRHRSVPGRGRVTLQKAGGNSVREVGKRIIVIQGGENRRYFRRLTGGRNRSISDYVSVRIEEPVGRDTHLRRNSNQGPIRSDGRRHSLLVCDDRRHRQWIRNTGRLRVPCDGPHAVVEGHIPGRSNSLRYLTTGLNTFRPDSAELARLRGVVLSAVSKSGAICMTAFRVVVLLIRDRHWD